MPVRPGTKYLSKIRIERMNQLLPYQKTGVEFLINRQHALLGDDMGLGKTIQALEAINQLKPKRVLIICPASVKLNWLREATEWLQKPYKIQILRTGFDTVAEDTEICIVNYELVIKSAIHWQLVNQKWSVGIVDEAHKLKNLEALRTYYILGKKAVLKNAHYKWMLTGTPILNRPIELYPMLKTLAVENIKPYDSLVRFGLRFCKGEETDIGWEFNGADNIPELRQRLEGFMLRRTKEEVLKDLPPFREQYLWLDDEMPDTDEFPLSTARRMVGESKIPGVVSHVEDVMENVPKAVIFAHHHNVIQELTTQLAQYNPVFLYGRLNAEQKQKTLDSFLNDSTVRICIMQTQMVQGMDGLQKVCSHAIFAELDWSPGVIDQARDRLIRIGQTSPILIQYILSNSPLDNAIECVSSDKRTVINELINERNPMSIEESLSRIAVALENMTANTFTIPVAEDPKPPTAAKTKAVAPKKKPVEVIDDDIFDSNTAPAPKAKTYTLDNVRMAAQKLVGSSDDIDGNKVRAKSIIRTVGKAEKMDEIDWEQYGAVIEALEEAAVSL